MRPMWRRLFVILVILLIVVASYQNYSVTEVVPCGPSASSGCGCKSSSSSEGYCACKGYRPWDGEEEEEKKKASSGHYA